MQIKIGNKIRELRRRDDRRQEDLANALGVTCQAVSRWESNGCYPDMEMIPSIANFFNISIDELFGYDANRREKIDEIIVKSEKMITSGENLADCIAMLREAVYRFPSEPQLLLNLGYALHVHGWRIYGLKGKTDNASDYGAVDTEYAAKNVFWQEAMTVFEKLITMDNVPERDTVILIMIADYSKMGETQKARRLAEKQHPLYVCRESMLVHATQGEERDCFAGEAIIALLNQLKSNMEFSLSTNKVLVRSGESQRLFLALADFYEKVFSDGRMGKAHSDMRDIYSFLATLEAVNGSAEKAKSYFDKAYYHQAKYTELESFDEYKYSAPVVSKVVLNCENIPKTAGDGLKDYLKTAPKALIDEIKKIPEYSGLV